MKKFVLAFLFFSVAAISAAGQALYTREKEWTNEINAFLEIDKKQTPPKDPIVFTGSSTIRMWTSLRQDFPNLNVMNRGFGGSRLDDLVFFAPKIVAPYKPKMIVVYSGENDIEGKETPENALEDFKAFVSFRDKTLPKTPIVYISMKPSILRWSLWPEMKRGNDLIRNEIGIATMAVGAIFEPDHVNSIIAAGRADLCALARPHLADPYWSLHAAAQLGYHDMTWPNPYLRGKDQLERNLARAAAMQANPPSSPEEEK